MYLQGAEPAGSVGPGVWVMWHSLETKKIT